MDWITEKEYDDTGYHITIRRESTSRYPRRCVTARRGEFQHSQFVDWSIWEKQAIDWLSDFMKGLSIQ